MPPKPDVDLPPTYVPRRDIPPIAPTPSHTCPLGPAARAALLSRRYDLASGQPLYRVRVEHLRARSASAPAPTPGSREDDNREVERTEEVGVWLADVLAYVSPAELERFELAYEEDVVVVVVDGEGAVLLASKEARQQMMAGWRGGEERPRWPAQGARGKKAPERAFVDLLPPDRRRGRPKKVRTAEVMGVVDGDEDAGGEGLAQTATDTGSETHEYGDWVDPASVRGTAPVEGGKDEKTERDELAASEDSGEQLGLWRARGEFEQPPTAHHSSRRASRSRTKSGTSSNVDATAKSRTRGRPKKRETTDHGNPRRTASILSMTSSSISESRSSRGAHTKSGTSSGVDASEEDGPRSRQKKREATDYGTTRRTSSVMSTTSSSVSASRSTNGARLRRSSVSSNEFFRSVNSHRTSTRSSTAASRSGSLAAAANGAANLLSAFGSTQTSRRKNKAREGFLHDPDATPRASQQNKSSRDGMAKESKRRLSTTSALHNASSMLHPPAEGISWEPEEPEEEEQEYEIESIITHKAFAEDTYYLVKWANWPPDNESWFTAEELEGAQEVLDEYLDNVRRKMKGKNGKGKGRMVEGASRAGSTSGSGRGLEAEDEEVDFVG